jgi:hypothetical protein
MFKKIMGSGYFRVWFFTLNACLLIHYIFHDQPFHLRLSFFDQREKRKRKKEHYFFPKKLIILP